MRQVGFLAVSIIVIQFDCATCADQSADLEQCVDHLPECLDTVEMGNRTEEDKVFGILAAWLQSLYTRQEPPTLAQDAGLRKSTLARLMKLAALSLERPSVAIGVGQMLFLYFWWGVQPAPDFSADFASTNSKDPVRGPDVEVVQTAADLHKRSISSASCDLAATSKESFMERHCPWRWRFLIMLTAELGRQLATEQRDLVKASTHLFAAKHWLTQMRALPFFYNQSLRGVYLANQNADFMPGAVHMPVWPRARWPSFAFFLELHADVFRAELEVLLHVDSGQEVFRVAQVQQTEFAPLPRDWATVDLVRKGGRAEGCHLAPQSCELLLRRPEVNEQCLSVPDAGVSLARLWPGTEIKPHFATDPRLAVHLGLRTPQGASMVVGGQEVQWAQGQVVVFDDTYVHSVQHRGQEARFILLAWICHPCDKAWRQGLGAEWAVENPVPESCHGDD